MTDFRVGDRVVVRNWEEVAAQYGGDEYSSETLCGFVKEMHFAIGCTATITHVDMTQEEKGCYEVNLNFDEPAIEEDASRYSWDTGMLALLSLPKYPTNRKLRV